MGQERQSVSWSIYCPKHEYTISSVAVLPGSSTENKNQHWCQLFSLPEWGEVCISSLSELLGEQGVMLKLYVAVRKETTAAGRVTNYSTTEPKPRRNSHKTAGHLSVLCITHRHLRSSGLTLVSSPAPFNSMQLHFLKLRTVFQSIFSPFSCWKPFQFVLQILYISKYWSLTPESEQARGRLQVMEFFTHSMTTTGTVLLTASVSSSWSGGLTKIFPASSTTSTASVETSSS